MKKLVFIIVAIMALNLASKSQISINQIDANGLKQGKWIGKYPSGSIRYEGSFVNDQPVGEMKRFHENGKMKALMFHFPNSDKVSAKLFDEDGMLYANGNYLKTAKDSTWTYFNNKKIVGREEFIKGVKNGRSVTYYEDGQPATESSWVNGVQNGVSRSFFPSGSTKSEIMYKDGKRNGVSLVYFESGLPEIIGRYVNDDADGSWKFQDEKGELKYELKYKAGVLLNPEIVDRIQANEFKAFDRAKGVLKDPADYQHNPEEIMRR
ncbi:MAG: toxin-antitoxin system YwqK family antitoxin [Mariniphaga sp.]